MNRFGDLDWSFKKLPPIFGFHSQDLVSLEQALQPLESQIKELRRYIEIAKDYCHYPNEQNLSKDQSASIYIYTMEWGETSLYRVLNQALRSENRQALKIWFPYLKLFDTALDLLPNVKESVWRGVPLDIGQNFTKDQVFIWWPISSCSLSISVIEQFLANELKSTLFLIQTVNGKNIAGYTQYEKEDEVILKFGTQFRVKDNPLKRADGSHIVHLIENDKNNKDSSLTPSAQPNRQRSNFDNILQIQSNDLNQSERIGHGDFGIVHRATWLTIDMCVAVKKLHITSLSNEMKTIFTDELSVLKRVRHPNIVTFYGICVEFEGENEQFSLVTEYMSSGSLYQLIHETKTQLSWSDRLSIALQAAKGINYLHQFQPQILHRNIKSSNVLINNHQSEYVVKISDFGLNQTRNEMANQSTPMTSILLWRAPELLRLRPYTDKSDIYSLGIVCWELASCQKPYDGYDNGNIREFILSGDRLEIPTKTPRHFHTVIEKCWAHKPEDRPNCSDLIKILSECIKSDDNNNPPAAATQPDLTNIVDSPNRLSFFGSFMQKVFGLTNDQISNLKWKQEATTIAGGNGNGNQLNQLSHPYGMCLDDSQQFVYIADWWNHRIMKWKIGANDGQIIAGGKGDGNRIDQVSYPTDVIVDRKSKSLIISDRKNHRVVRWSLDNKQDDKQIVISNCVCWGLKMNNDNGDLFVSDFRKHEVKKWRKGEKDGVVIAGGNGQGNQLNQLNCPTYIFIDRNETLYVSDWGNHRVMKWDKDAQEGIVVAGGQGQGSTLKQLSNPQGLAVNEVGDVYVADYGNHRIMCWLSGAKESRVIVGENNEGKESNQLNGPMGLSFDRQRNLFVVDNGNHRIQRFDVEKS